MKSNRPQLSSDEVGNANNPHTRIITKDMITTTTGKRNGSKKSYEQGNNHGDSMNHKIL